MPRLTTFRSNSPAHEDDIDAITPCPSPTSEEAVPTLPTTSTTTASSSSSSPTFPSLSTHDVNEVRHSRSPSPTNSDVSSSSTFSSPSTGARTMHSRDTSSARGSRDQRRDSLRVVEAGTDGDTERLWRRMLALQQVYGCYKSARMSAALSSGDPRLWLPSKACLNLLNDNIGLLPDDVEQVLQQTPNSSA